MRLYPTLVLVEAQGSICPEQDLDLMGPLARYRFGVPLPQTIQSTGTPQTITAHCLVLPLNGTGVAAAVLGLGGMSGWRRWALTAPMLGVQSESARGSAT